MLFSIIIPTRNRHAALDRCLHALAGLDFQTDRFEVLIIDDGSTPAVDPIVQRFAAALPVRLLTQSSRGPAAARNLGLQMAVGRFAVFTDDDCRPERNWLIALQQAFERDPDSGWGGSVEPAPENGIFGNASQLLVSYLYRYDHERLHFFCTNNIAFPRHALRQLGGFDESFPLAAAEDREICDRWIAQSSLQHAPEAMVLHHQNLNFASFWRQHYRYGRGAFHFHARRVERGQAGLRVEPWHFYSGMLCFPWSVYPFATATAICALFIAAQAGNAAGYVHERLSTS